MDLLLWFGTHLFDHALVVLSKFFYGVLFSLVLQAKAVGVAFAILNNPVWVWPVFAPSRSKICQLIQPRERMHRVLTNCCLPRTVRLQSTGCKADWS
jgi:hypothetical protein